MNREIFWQQFPLGSHLCREPMPSMREMKRDMEILKRNGFNLIKLQENWMVDEPAEGVYDFSRYHELIEYAQRLDMGVYLGLTCEQAPNWLFAKYPDCHMENASGQRVAYIAQSTLSADGKPGPCFDHPGAMEAQKRFIKELVSELGQHENIVVWNTWQEIAYWAERLAGGHVCYCPNTIRRYQQWLSERYGGSIDALNAHWNCRYAAFDQVQPDRSPVSAVTPQHFYYRYFIDNVKLADTLKVRCEVIRENDPHHRPVFAHKGGIDIGSGLDWTLARAQDFLGTSCYPAWGCGHAWDDVRQSKRLDRYEALKAEMWSSVALRMDYLRSASKPGAPVWAAEFQGGPIAMDLHIGRTPDAGDIRRWMLTALGVGVTAISFWVTRAEIMASETNGFALLDSEGEETERLAEASRIGRALQSYSPLFRENNKFPARVAILVDEWKYQLCGGMSSIQESIGYDVRGWYKLLWEAGIPCDFIEASADICRLNAYAALIVPIPIVMSDPMAQTLVDYARAGGHIILEGGAGRLNEAAFAARGEMNPILRDALNVERIKSFRMIREPDSNYRWTHPEVMYGEYVDFDRLEGCGALAGIQIAPNVYIETYAAKDEEVCLRFKGRPAGLRRSVGKGSILLIGTCLGHNATAHTGDSTGSFAQKLLALCGVVPEHDGRLLIQKRGGDSAQAWFITNPASTLLSEAIAVPHGFEVVDALEGREIPISNGTIRLCVESLDVCLLILKRK